MGSYIRIGALSCLSLLTIYYYYFIYAFHNTSRGTTFFVYLLIIFIIYGGYKLFQNILEVKQVTFSKSVLILLFLAQLLLLSFFHFGSIGGNALLGSVLFLKILFLLVGITLLWLFIYSLGYTLLQYFGFFSEEEDTSFQVLSSLGVGFFVFMLGIFILAVGSMYETLPIIIWMIGVAGVGYKKSFKIITSLKEKKISYSLSDGRSYMRLMLDEIHYIIITLLLGVNFVSAYRPFPIGWDDLGVYMNYPKLFAQAGEIIPLGQMETWELYTGIGHVFGNQTLAFLLNSFSGVIVGFVVYFALSGIFKKYKNIAAVDFALLTVMVLLMMPMAVFQLAKDMKLDYGLFAMSIPPLYMMYYMFLQKENFSTKKLLSSLFVIGLLVGLAFSIKITSLLLVLAIIGLIVYKKFSLIGFFGYFWIFISLFSYLGLWGMMNVVFPQGNSEFVNIFSFLSFALGVGFFVYSFFTDTKALKKGKEAGINILVFIIGFSIALFPWALYHYSVAPEKGIGIHTILGGGLGHSGPDYKSLYTEKEIGEKLISLRGIEDIGTTTNADFGRYFGYEKGINNYLKLPWNLTFQVNQGGEFTEITYIFLTLFPALLLFLPYRKEIYMYVVLGFILLTFLYYIGGPVSIIFTNYFSHISLPGGYLHIFLLAFAPLVFFYYTLDRTQKSTKIFLGNYVFLTLYGFLWAISAFGVVWYGILMYISFLISISVCLISAQIHHEKISGTTLFISLGTIWVYVLISVIPQALNNISTAGYSDYKLGKQTQEESIMLIHPDYVEILYNLNIDPDYQQEMFTQYRNKLLEIVDTIPDTESLNQLVRTVGTIGQLTRLMNQIQQYNIGASEKDLLALRQDLFENILYPKEKLRNTHSIYRVGTFIKYFVSENHKRFLEDSLLTVYEDYFYDESPELVIERMKKIDVRYILVDLNAATIDQDPRKQLTGRYENLLRFIAQADIRLIESDSVCLKVAIDGYKKDTDMDKYLNIAGVNYEPNKGEKRGKCIIEILNLIEQNQISVSSYPYLAGYQKLVVNSYDENKPGDFYMKLLNDNISGGYKAIFEIQ